MYIVNFGNLSLTLQNHLDNMDNMKAIASKASKFLLKLGIMLQIGYLIIGLCFSYMFNHMINLDFYEFVMIGFLLNFLAIIIAPFVTILYLLTNFTNWYNVMKIILCTCVCAMGNVFPVFSIVTGAE